MEKKVLIIGLDGGTWTVLNPAIEQGYMPFLKSLVENGASGILESTIPAITPAAWGTFQTGCNPGTTGVYDFTCWDQTTKKTSLVNSTNLPPTIWQILSQSGKRVVSLNVPMTYPPQPINGHLISCILTPSMKSGFTYPPEFKEELLRRFPEYQILNLKTIPKQCPSESRIKKFIENLVRIMTVHADAACYILQNKPSDVMMVHFQETDVIQHLLWKYLDPACPDSGLSIQRAVFSTFFSALDKQIERLVKTLNAMHRESLTVIVSDHGFEANNRCFNLGNWLIEQGYLGVNPEILNHPVKRQIRAKAAGLLRLMPFPYAQRLRGRLNAKNYLIDWNRSAVYSEGTSEGFIFLLEQGLPQRFDTAARIRTQLQAVTDPLNHQPVIKRIYLKEELYSGGKMHLLPDMIIEPNEGYSILGRYQHKKGLFTSVASGETPLPSGKHHRNGVIVAFGKGVKRSASLHVQLIEMLPTILCYMGVPVPSFIEGQAHVELFEKDFLEKEQAPSGGSAAESPKQNTFAYSSRERELIERRLKDLGYLQ
ncbi:MAG: alkaline phosphatase family protein [Planctomycetales bacterium]|nr:alkaline phosphatase family protein [Planctomycetales bacterium]